MAPNGTRTNGEVLERWEIRSKDFFFLILFLFAFFSLLCLVIVEFFFEGKIWVDWEVNRIRIYV